MWLIAGLTFSVALFARAQQVTDFTGVWLAYDVTYAPWTFDLKQTGTALTGRVWQNGAVTAVTQITAGVVTGNRLSFKLNGPGAGGVISFSGTRNSDSIDFTRSSEKVGQAGSGDGLYGADPSAPRRLTAKLQPPGTVATPPPGAINAPLTAVVPNMAPIYPKPQTGPEGRWQVAAASSGPWTFEFTVDGTSLHGTIRQNGSQANPVSIAAGKIDGTSITFKALSPDGERVIAFGGRLNGDEIAFVREITVLAGGTRGGSDLYGSSPTVEFTANRLSTTLTYKGMLVDIAEIQSAPDREAIIDGVRHQIDIVDDVAMKPEQKAFLKSVPVSLNHLIGGADNGTYTNPARGVLLPTGVLDGQKPILLHELLHAYQDQKMPEGFRNAAILQLYQQARDSQQFPAGSYMLSGAVEYFAMMGSVYLHGSAARDPNTREAIKEKQPDCYKWLEQEFGPR